MPGLATQGKRTQRLVRACLCVLLVGALTEGNAASTSRAHQKKLAEGERAELRQKLKALKSDINKTESAKDKADDALETSEQAISEAKRALHDLHQEQTQTEDKLRQLSEERNYLSASVEKQKKQLSDFLRQQYMRGDSDRIKLLLSGDNPNRINRQLQYMSYISQTQAKMIASLRVSLLAVEKNTLATLEAKDELDEIAQEEREHKAALEIEKSRRSKLLNQLADKLHTQKKQAADLQNDEQRLNNLVSRLNLLIEQQIKAEQAKAAQTERQRKEKLLAEQAQREKAQQPGQTKKSGKIINPNAIDADQPPSKAIAKNAPGAAEWRNDGSAFARLKGQLHLPVRGDLLAKFGSKRGDGPNWKGLFIKAAEGVEIKAIAAGKVIMAEWMRGYGNMIILDHGGNYLSVYAYTQSVLKHVGDTVKTGEIIASAGNSGGNEESGLYFELRHQGRVFDPLSWVGKAP